MLINEEDLELIANTITAIGRYDVIVSQLSREYVTLDIRLGTGKVYFDAP